MQVQMQYEYNEGTLCVEQETGKVEAKWRWTLAGTFAVAMVLNGLAGGSTLLGGVDTPAACFNLSETAHGTIEA